MPPETLTKEQVAKLMGGNAPETLTPEQVKRVSEQQEQKGLSRFDSIMSDRNKRIADETSKLNQEATLKEQTSPLAENISLWERVKRMGKTVAKSEMGFGQSIADAIMPMTDEYQQLEKARADATRSQQVLWDYIQAKKAKGEDTSNLMKAYQSSFNIGGTSDFDIMPSLNKTNKQVIGEAAGVGLDIISFGTLGSAAKYVAGAKTVGQGILRGGAVGLAEGAIIGAGQGGARAAQDNMDAGGIAANATIGGVVGGALGGVLGGAFGGIAGKINRSKEIRNALRSVDESGVPGSTAAGFSKNNAGILIRDRVADRAIKAGVSPDDVQLMKASNEATKDAFRKMYRVAEFTSEHKTSTQRASDIGGESVVKRLRYLFTTREGVGKQIGALMDNAPEKPVYITDTYIDYIKDLGQQGVTVKKGGVLDFAESRFRDNPAAQKILLQVAEDLKVNKNGTLTLTPKRIYRLRQIWFDNLDLAVKKKEIVASDPTGGIVENVRRNLEKHLTSAVPGYGKKAQQYAELSTILRDQQRLLGKDFNLKSPQVIRRASEVYNRMMGNASARPLTVLGQLEEASKKYGYKGGDNLRHMFLFADFMEDVFPTTIPRRGLKGEMLRAGGGGVNTADALLDVARGDVVGSGVKNAIKGIFKHTDSELHDLQVKAIKALIGIRN